MSTWEDTWKDIDITVPTLLPLGAVPQEPDPGLMLQYIQGLHNYLAGDRMSIVRALNVLGRFRGIQSDDETDTAIVASGSGASKIQLDTGMMYFDDIRQEANSGAKWTPIIPAYSADTLEPTGFVNTNEDSTFGVSGTNFTITPTGDDFSFYVSGVKFTKTAVDSVSLTPANAEGNWFIYYDNTGTLVLDDSVVFEDIIKDNCFVAELYHDGNNIIFGMDERHGLMPWQSHLWQHITTGTIRRSGFGLAGLTVDQNGNDDEDAEATAVAGIMMDEDITHSLAAQTTVWQCMYLNAGAWALTDSEDTAPLLYDALGPTPQYNDISVPGSESLEDVGNNKFFLSHIFATNITNDGQGAPVNGHIVMIGQNEYLTKTAARDGANTEISNLLTAGLPMPEFLPVGTIIFQHKGSNKYGAAAVSTDAGEDYVSWIGAEIQPGTPPAAHPNLTLRDDPAQHPAESISCDTSAFGGILSAAEDEVQAALDVIDDHTHVEADITDLGSYLPLAGGNLTGNLFIDKEDPSLYLRESGSASDYMRVFENGTTAQIQKVAATGAALISLRPVVSDGTSLAEIDMFRTTNTAGTVYFIGYVGDGTATEAWRFNAGTGSINLLKQGGSLYLDEGNLYLDKTANPTIYLREGGSTSNYGYIQDEAATLLSIYKRVVGGTSTIRIDPVVPDGTQDTTIQLFRTTNTTGAKFFYVHKGDGTSTVQHYFNGSGAAQFCRVNGNCTIGSTTGGTEQLSVVGDGSFTEQLTVGYLGAAPASPANGMMWMESDGLHIYYGGAEKVVAGV